MSTLLGLVIGLLATITVISAQNCNSCVPSGTKVKSGTNQPDCTCDDYSNNCPQEQVQCLCQNGYKGRNCETQAVGSQNYACSVVICGSWYENEQFTWEPIGNLWCCYVRGTVSSGCGTCINGQCSGTTCVCNQGWTGNQCDISTQQPDWCSTASGQYCTTSGSQTIQQSNPCDGVGQKCNCVSGWTGTYCDQQQTTSWCTTTGANCRQFGNVDQNQPCIEPNQVCNCISGWSGQYCDSQVSNWCSTSNGQYCSTSGSQTIQQNDPCDGVGQKCNCVSGWTGTYCDQQQATSWCTTTGANCRQIANVDLNQPCIEPNQGCNCISGWSGQYCDSQPTWCTNNEATCRIYRTVDQSFPCTGQNNFCNCITGYTGQFCQQIAQQNFCQRTQNCQGYANVDQFNPCNGNNEFCNCASGFTGQYCEQTTTANDPNFRCDIQQPECYNGGTCEVNSAQRVTSCNCAQGYTQYADCQGVFFCPPGKCQNGGQCDEFNDRCNCANGYTGTTCEVAPSGACFDNNQCNGGTCIGSVCQCPNGQFGRNCEQRAGDPCDASFCTFNGQCTYDGFGQQQCTCNSGWIGTNCNTNDPCFTQLRCLNGGTCKGLDINNFQCTCAPGWGGNTCEQSTDPCNPNPCLNGGQCSFVSGRAVCSCPNNDFVGDTCETRNFCKGVNCNNRGSCINEPNNYRCECTAEFIGTDCQTINYCNTKSCFNGGTCTNAANQGVCSCIVGFKGENCELRDPCQPNPCNNNGQCIEDTTQNTFVCNCRAGFGNYNCEMNMGQNDPCYNDDFVRVCQNDGICRSWFDANRQGTNISPYYWNTCFCLGGFTGENCQIANNPCLPNPCTNAVCSQDSTTTSGFKCTCNQGFTGDGCLERNYCAGNPCLNGATCLNLATDFTCVCPSGLTGDLCTQTDFCAQSDLCENGGTCVNLAFGPSCLCGAQWTGATCNQAVQVTTACTGVICQNSGTCILVGVNNYRCECTAGYSGTFCQNAVGNACTGLVCQNGGTCLLVGTNDFNCFCKPGYSGSRCQTENPVVKPCDKNPCKNGAIRCDNVNNNNDFKCTCRTPWTGDTCTVNSGVTTLPPLVTLAATTVPGGSVGTGVKEAGSDESTGLDLSKGVIVAIAIAGLAILVGFIRLIVYCCQRGSGKR